MPGGTPPCDGATCTFNELHYTRQTAGRSTSSCASSSADTARWVPLPADHDARGLYIAIQANDPAFYVEAHRGIFRGFWEHGISPRYLTPAALIDFVRRGGVSFSEGRFGLVNRDGYLYPHIPVPARAAVALIFEHATRSPAKAG